MDVIIHTTPKQVIETLTRAQELGTKELIILCEQHEPALKDVMAASKDAYKGSIKTAILVGNVKEAQKYQAKYDYLFGKDGRDLLENKLVNYHYGLEVVEEKDKTHRRGSGTNQVTAKLLLEKGKTYVYDLSTLIDAKDQGTTLGRMSQNKRILSKYGVPQEACSFAKEPLGLRGEKERRLFLEEL